MYIYLFPLNLLWIPIGGTLALAGKFLWLFLPTWHWAPTRGEVLCQEPVGIWENRYRVSRLPFFRCVSININQHSPSEAGKTGLQSNPYIAFCQQLTVVLWLEISEEEISEKTYGLSRNQGHWSQTEGQVWSRKQRNQKKKSASCEGVCVGESQLFPSWSSASICFPRICQLSLLLRKHFRQNPQLPS